MRLSKIYEIIKPISEADATYQLRFIVAKDMYLNIIQADSFEQAVCEYERLCLTCSAPLRVVGRDEVE